MNRSYEKIKNKNEEKKEKEKTLEKKDNLLYIMDYKVVLIIILHMHFLETSLIFGDHFNWHVLIRAFQQCAACVTDPKICRDTSKMATHLTGVSLTFLTKRGDLGF